MTIPFSLDFKKLMAGRFLYTLAVQIQAIVLGWHMYDLTRSPLHLGLIGLTEAIPALGLALFAGYIVDHSRPLVIYRRLVYVSLLSGLILFLSQLPQLNLSKAQEIYALFASSFLTGLARAFSQPAIFSIVPRLVSRERLAKSSAWMSSSMQIARISGPAIGGLLFGFIGVEGSSATVCATLLLASAALFLIEIEIPPQPKLTEKKSFRFEVLSGAKFVLNHPILLPAMALDMVSVLFGGVTALLPIYAAEVLMIGPIGLGLLRASPAVGASITSLWLTQLNFHERAGKWFLTSVAGFGICILVFALSRNYMVSFIALAFSGAFDSVSMVVRTTAVQLFSPDAMRGRISAVNSIFIGSSNELGEFESGVTARFMGTVPAAVFGGVMCVLTVIIVTLKSTQLRKLDLSKIQ